MSDALADRVEDLEAKVDALHNARRFLTNRLDVLEAENAELRRRVDEMADYVEVVDASMATPQRDKLDKIRAILDYAGSKTPRGPSGVSLQTGEVAAAASGSRNWALRLMDEIAANFDWASVENPGGPNPKQLKLEFGHSVAELKAEVVEFYANHGRAEA